eukprot:scaffold15993_cov22-Tisochrysis_lutea.AAC.1
MPPCFPASRSAGRARECAHKNLHRVVRHNAGRACERVHGNLHRVMCHNAGRTCERVHGNLHRVVCHDAGHDMPQYRPRHRLVCLDAGHACAAGCLPCTVLPHTPFYLSNS